MRVGIRKAGVACGSLVASALLAFSSPSWASSSALVIGGLDTPVSFAIVPFANQSKVPFVGPWAAGTGITKNGAEENYIFRVSAVDEYVDEAITEYLVTKYGSKKPGMILINNPWGESNEKGLLKALEKRGMEHAGIEKFESNDVDVVPQLTRLKEAFRADVHGMAARLDELRKTNVKLQVDARVNSRLVARQNQGLRKQLSLVAVRTTHVRYKLVAFLGWRFVVRWRKSEDTGVEQVRFEREEKESMVEYLEKKIKESRKASEARLKAQRASHKTKLGHTEQQLEETREALGRLKSFSAAKLRSLSEELEAMRDDQVVTPANNRA